MAGAPDSGTKRSIRRNLIAGLVLAVMLVVATSWAFTTELAGAVIAQGQIVVESEVKKIQHPFGGVVGEMRIREGQHVKAGDILLKLDETQARANLLIVSKALDELSVRKAREQAEQDGKDGIDFPADLLSRRGEPDIARLLSEEQRLFENRRTGREGQKAQLRERISQLREEIIGFTAQASAKAQEIEWVSKELEGVRDLWEKRLVQFTRVTALERDAARIAGERGNLIASIAQSKGKIAEIELQIIQVDQDMRTEIGKDLAEIRGKMSELTEKRIAAEDQLRRIDIRSPQNGAVHQLEVHAVGAVISQGQTIMLIVPDEDLLTVEAKVQPQDIDQVYLGQAAIVRFSGLNQRVTPELNGKITLISANVIQDQRAAGSFYSVRIAVSEQEVARLEGVKLIPGMPVDAFIQTTPRTIFSYLTRPLTDQMLRAFREK